MKDQHKQTYKKQQKNSKKISTNEATQLCCNRALVPSRAAKRTRLAVHLRCVVPSSPRCKLCEVWTRWTPNDSADHVKPMQRFCFHPALDSTVLCQPWANCQAKDPETSFLVSLFLAILVVRAKSSPNKDVRWFWIKGLSWSVRLYRHVGCTEEIGVERLALSSACPPWVGRQKETKLQRSCCRCFGSCCVQTQITFKSVLTKSSIKNQNMLYIYIYIYIYTYVRAISNTMILYHSVMSDHIISS